MVNSPDQRPIAVFTGSRAEYGLMRHLVAGIAAAPKLEFQLIVSGSHLSAFHGGTLASRPMAMRQQPWCRCHWIRSRPAQWRR